MEAAHYYTLRKAIVEKNAESEKRITVRISVKLRLRRDTVIGRTQRAYRGKR